MRAKIFKHECGAEGYVINQNRPQILLAEFESLARLRKPCSLTLSVILFSTEKRLSVILIFGSVHTTRFLVIVVWFE